METTRKEDVRAIVRDSILKFSNRFVSRHIEQLDNPDGVINAKVHNIFMSALGPQTQFYSALIRSLDSSLGKEIEHMALRLASHNFIVSREVTGELYVDQTRTIADLLQKYQSLRSTPSVSDYQVLRNLKMGPRDTKVHKSDYLLQDIRTGKMHLIELKLGGDLDNKKARSEKEALLEQYCILSNNNPKSQAIEIHFATGYNSYGEGNYWKQGRVRQFFADEELLISSDFWNFILQDPEGFSIVTQEFKSMAHHINSALETLKEAYVG